MTLYHKTSLNLFMLKALRRQFMGRVPNPAGSGKLEEAPNAPGVGAQAASVTGTST